MFLVYVLGATPDHIPLKYRCPTEISHQIRDFYLIASLLQASIITNYSWKYLITADIFLPFCFWNIPTLPFIVRATGFETIDHATVFRSFEWLHYVLTTVPSGVLNVMGAQINPQRLIKTNQNAHILYCNLYLEDLLGFIHTCTESWLASAWM